MIKVVYAHCKNKTQKGSGDYKAESELLVCLSARLPGKSLFAPGKGYTYLKFHTLTPYLFYRRAHISAYGQTCLTLFLFFSRLWSKTWGGDQEPDAPPTEPSRRPDLMFLDDCKAFMEWNAPGFN